MTYYTDGYGWYSANKDDFEDNEIFEFIDIEHQDGDFYLAFMDDEADITIEHSLDEALESWSVNCDNIYQVRDGVVIRYFSTLEGDWSMNQPYKEFVEELIGKGYIF